jgi:predicted phage-related endonuclease
MTDEKPTIRTYPTREAWLAARRHTLGSSDAPVILGIGHRADSSSSRSLYQLWAEKTGKLEPEPPPPALARRFRVGHVMERAAEGELDAELRGAVIRPSDLQEVKEGGAFVGWRRAWRACAPDFLQSAPDQGLIRFSLAKVLGPIEVKTVEPVVADDWQDGPSSYALVQVHHQMHVGGWSEAWIAAWIGFGDFRLYHVTPDVELMETMLEAEERFWVDHVQADVPPAVDASPSCTRTLRRLHPKDSGETKLVESETLLADVMQLEADKEEAKALKEEIDLLENRVREACGDATELVVTTGGVAAARFTWKWQSRAGYSVEPTETRTLLKRKL